MVNVQRTSLEVNINGECVCKGKKQTLRRDRQRSVKFFKLLKLSFLSFVFYSERLSVFRSLYLTSCLFKVTMALSKAASKVLLVSLIKITPFGN